MGVLGGTWKLPQMVIERPSVHWCMMAQCLNAPHQRLPENFALQYLTFSATERDATGER